MRLKIWIAGLEDDIKVPCAAAVIAKTAEEAAARLTAELKKEKNTRYVADWEMVEVPFTEGMVAIEPMFLLQQT